MPEHRVTAAVAADFPRVLPLLRELGEGRISDERWRRVFSTRWPAEHSHCGYLLEADGAVQGFLGTLFSRRETPAGIERVCNMTSWIVRKEARSGSLAMLAEVLGLDDHSLTNFTPSQTVAKLLSATGFAEVQRAQRALFAAPAPSRRPKGMRLETRLKTIAAAVRGADRQILEDHAGYECHHTLLELGEEYCYIVSKRIVRSHLPFVRPHYISNPSLFRRLVDHARTRMCLQAAAVGLMVEEGSLEGAAYRFSRAYPKDSRWFIRRSAGGSEWPLDTLYSELILLHA